MNHEKPADSYEGITIKRAATVPTLRKGLTGKVVAYLSFMVTALWAGLATKRPDVVIGTSPPLFQLLPAWLIALLRRRPFILEIRDLWPAFAVDMGVLKNRHLIRVAEWVERFFYARAAQIIVNSPAYIDYLAELGISQAKLRLIPNGVDPQVMLPSDEPRRVRATYGLEDKFVVTYAGMLGLANDVEILAATAERLRGDDDIHLLIVGDGLRKTQLESWIDERSLANVTLASNVPKNQIADILAASDACLATLQDIPMFRMTYPNKVFDYMAAGRPTILAIDGVIREVLENGNGGLFVPPGDSDAIADAVRHLRDHRDAAKRMGESARKYVEQHFHRDDHALLLETGLNQVISDSTLASQRATPYARWWKRPMDIALASVAFLVLSPLLVAIALFVLVTLGRPIFYKDRRAGRLGKPFDCWKFRTMADLRNEHGDLLDDDSRRSTAGDWLRSSSLDELPQLWNILCGEMSFIGPRPLTTAYLDRYSAEQLRRHNVRPGLTGWAQVNGRTSISWERKFELDLWYVERVSLLLDAKILTLTFGQLFGFGVSTTAADMSETEFAGSKVSQV